MALSTEGYFEREEVFLDALRETANVTVAARAAGMSSGAAYALRSRDPMFADRWQEAINEGVDLLEHEAARRAFKGFDETVYYKGEACGVNTRYSDALAMFLLKAHRPDKYRERTEVQQRIVDANGNALREVRPEELTDEQLAGLASKALATRSTIAQTAAEVREALSAPKDALPHGGGDYPPEIAPQEPVAPSLRLVTSHATPVVDLEDLL